MANTFKNAHSVSVGTAYATTYASPSSTTTVVLGMSLCNKTTGGITVDVQFRDSASTAVKMLTSVDIPAGSTLEVLAGQKYILEATDDIQVKSSAANSLDVVMGVMEIT
mgnify:CR=1 FL=1|jgi:hypothetical protein